MLSFNFHFNFCIIILVLYIDDYFVIDSLLDLITQPRYRAISWQRPTTNIYSDMVCVKLIQITEWMLI